MNEAVSELPLFPLNVVLFPQMMLPLHIFEERYKEMARTCLEQNSRFGVVLIREGQETGEPAIPHNVGTSARIARATPLEEGRMNIITLGERRFRLEEVCQWRPYLKGRVRFFDPEDVGEPRPTVEMIETLRATLEQYLRALLGLRGGWVRQVESPTDPVDLSFYIPAVLRGENHVRQRILEAPTALERLDLLTPLLRAANDRTRVELEKHASRHEAHLN